MHRIDGPGATVDNKFTDGDPVGGVQATVVTDAWLNDIQEELIGILSAAGVTPSKGSQDQVLQAIYKLAQSQKATAFATAGTATALTLTPVPAISAYAANQRFNVKFSVASGANPTLNVSALGGKSLKRYDASGAKVAATFAAGQISDVVYDGTDLVVLDQLPAATVQATELVLGSLKVSTQVLTDAGVDDTTSVTPKKLRNGFSASIGLSGFIALPTWMGGLIFQWMFTTSATTNHVLTLPLAAPTELLAVIPACQATGAGTSNIATWDRGASTLSSVRISTSGSNNIAIFVICR